MGSIGQILGGVVGGIVGFIVGGPPGAVTGFSFGYTIGGLVFGIDLPNGTRGNEFSVTGATEGTAPDIVFGLRPVNGNIIFFGAVTTEEITDSGKGAGGGAVTELRPFAPVHLTLALGTLRAFHGVKDGKGEDWEALNTSVGGSAFQLSTGLGTNFNYAEFSAPLRGITTIFSPRLYMGPNSQSFPPLRFFVDIQPDSTLGDPYAGYTTGCSAAAILWTLLTNKQWGRGLDPSTLHLASWTAANDLLSAEDRGLNFREPAGTPGALERMIESVLFHINAILRTGNGGLLELYPLRNDYVPVTIADVDMRDVQATTQTWAGVKNDLKGSFPDAAKDYAQGEVPMRNDAVIEMTGIINTAEYDFPHFTDRNNVARRLAELMDEVSFPTMILSFRTAKKFHKMRVGDVFSITHRAYGLVSRDFRIFEVSEGDFGKEEMIFKVRAVRASLIVNYVPPTPSPEAPTPIVVPVDVVDVGGMADYWKHPRVPSGGGGGGNGGGGDGGPPGTPPLGPFVVNSPNDLSPPAVDEEYWGYPLRLWAARGSGRDIGCFFETVNAIESELPVAVQGRTYSNRWAFAFVTLDRIERDDFRYASSEFPLRLQFVGYAGQTVQFPDNTPVDANGFLKDAEEGRWALLIGNTELWTFRQVVSLGGGNYKIVVAFRGVNKEYAYGWPAGTPVMIVDTRAPYVQDHMTWLAWAHRQRYVDILDYDGVDARIRTFCQSVDLRGTIQAADDGFGGPTGKTWLKREGSVKADACGFYRPHNEALANRAPFPACQAFRVGTHDVFRKWYADISGLSANDLVVEFPPFPDDDTGAGDRVCFDELPTIGYPYGPPVEGFESFPKLATDAPFDSFVGPSAAVNGQTYRLFVTASVNDDPLTSAVRTIDIVFDGTETSWPAFVYLEADQAFDGQLNNIDSALWVSVLGRNLAWARPRLVHRHGPYPPQTHPSLLQEPV